jgi:hypothetical protein
MVSIVLLSIMLLLALVLLALVPLASPSSSLYLSYSHFTSSLPCYARFALARFQWAKKKITTKSSTA